MKQVALGHSGLTVSELCMGAMNFGTTVEKETAFRLLDAFVDGGGTFLDTSNNYAHWAGTGDESETLLGEWFARSGKRDKVVLATKLGFDRHGAGQGLKAHQIEYWCDESLRKLRTDAIDLYYAHVDDMDTPLEETMTAFDRLIQKGKVRAIGGSNYYTWRLEEARETCQRNQLTPYSVVQQRFTYLFAQGGIQRPYPYNENAGIEKLRYLAKHNIPLVAYSCMARGGYADNSRLPDMYIRGERLATLNRLARGKGVEPASLVIAWMLHSRRFTDRPQIIPLFSCSSVEHLQANLDAASLSLTTQEAYLLNEA
ncbi:aldo/keto reductase [Ruminococcaceae bacterium OttesenSCG-928-L11]|nr:aldo/keto reductase [Ruminococcaceae bacterium OttesenSCG-928-L11]